MKRCSINDIKGGEILASPILSSEYQVLLAEGTMLQKEYVEKFRELGIKEVFIKEERKERTQEEKRKVEKEIKQKFGTQIKNVLEKHIYQENSELETLSTAASGILEDILQEENIADEIIEIRERSSDLYEHSISCCVLSTILSLRMGLSHEKIHAIGVGCLLHDMGLRYISVTYGDTNMEDMSEGVRSEYRKHTVYGYSSVEKEKWLDSISKNIILSHHERKDGSGYPFHTRELPTEVGIVSVCDTFDEMICGIGCKKTKIYKAIEYLKFFKNTKFDDTIVDEFLKTMASYPVGSHVLLNTGEIGVVIRQNKGFSERPVIRIISDSAGKPVFRERILNLLTENSVFVEDVIN